MSKVSIIRCESYDTESVYDAVKRGIESLGGIKFFLNDVKSVLLKPNLLRAHDPSKATTTHPAVFEAVIRITQEAGYNVSYGDSPGIGSPLQVSKVAGLYEVSQKYNVPLKDFESGSVVSFPDGIASKQFEIAKGVLESDAIVSIPKMKAHQLTRITGAVKNQLGCVYGLNKAAFHIKFPNPLDFCKMLTDLNKLVKTKLYIMDGIVAMEGNGPAGGTPKPMNCIIISDDPVAIDATFARMINLDIKYVPVVQFGEESGLGSALDIEYLGDPIESFYNPSFDVVRSPVKDETPFGPLAFLKNLVIRRPFIVKDLCRKCSLCVEACPVPDKALTQKSKSTVPVYDYNKCIRCYCCQEMCPHKAIKVKIPLLGKMFFYRNNS